MRLKINLSLILITVGFGSTSFAINYPLTPLSELGIQKKINKASDKDVYEFLNSKTKNTIVYQYAINHMVESIEVKNQAGLSLEKTRFLTDRIWKQTPTKLDEWIINKNGRGVHRVTELSGKKRIREYPYQESLELSCAEDTDKDLKQVESTAKDLDTEISIRIENAKIKTTGCEKYDGGELALIKDMQSAMDAGSKCLLGNNKGLLSKLSLDPKINSPESNNEGMKLRAFFESKTASDINLYCGNPGDQFKVGDKDVAIKSNFMARAWIAPNVNAPAVFVNLKEMGKASKNERKGVLFHEMLHWLGILHSESFDTPYIASQCCMADDNESPNAVKACDLLNMSPRPEVDSKKYLHDFTEMMLLSENSQVPMRTIFRSTGRKLKDQPTDLSAQYEAALLIKNQKDGNASADVYVYSLQKLDPKLNPVVLGKSSYDQAVAATGDFITSIQQGSSYEDQQKNSLILNAKYKELLGQTTDEKEKVKLLTSIHQWVSNFTSLDTDNKTSDAEAAKAKGLWSDLDKDLK